MMLVILAGVSYSIPQPVRAALHLREGDEIAYAIEDGRVILTRAQPDKAADDPLPDCKVWDLVKVPFPYTNRPVQQRRPVLVVAIPDTPGAPHLLWVLMVTSAASRDWRCDVSVSDLAVAGLPAPSVVRSAKIATIEARDTNASAPCPPTTGPWSSARSGPASHMPWANESATRSIRNVSRKLAASLSALIWSIGASGVVRWTSSFAFNLAHPQ